MKKILVTFLCSILLLTAVSCTSQNDKKITSFHFASTGSQVEDYYSFSVYEDNGETYFYAVLDSGSEEISLTVSNIYLDDAKDIVDDHELYKWNGFNKTDQMMMDGDGFTLRVMYEDESELYAHGYGEFPQGFADAKAEMDSLMQEIIKNPDAQ